ncbi:S-adenosylmethionine decarboxylase [Candidatus Pacearchaeota archaeon CG10_big_fil_rev_8_21_14_0_10_32_14]|nr:MAG: S-adenosylmethionine decarboxylase [Candidatus Pacearchaeota archaeon CG10_big_fil_rev_8_21_14_0_10_32_14]
MDEVKRAYEQKNAWGIEAQVDLHDCNPNYIRDADFIKQFVVDLCEYIGMKRYGECQVVNFGEDERVAGFSMTQLIETSLISGHFANQTNNVYLNVFSCKYFNPKDVAEFSKSRFQAADYSLHNALRK